MEIARFLGSKKLPQKGGVTTHFGTVPPLTRLGEGDFNAFFKKNDRKTAKIAPAARVYCLFYAYIGIYRP